MESHRVNSICALTNINHHVGTPKQKQTSYYLVYSTFGLRVPDYGTVTFYR